MGIMRSLKKLQVQVRAHAQGLHAVPHADTCGMRHAASSGAALHAHKERAPQTKGQAHPFHTCPSSAGCRQWLCTCAQPAASAWRTLETHTPGTVTLQGMYIFRLSHHYVRPLNIVSLLPTTLLSGDEGVWGIVLVCSGRAGSSPQRPPHRCAPGPPCSTRQAVVLVESAHSTAQHSIAVLR